MNRDHSARAFTLIELLIVITIIVILMGLLFPAFRGVQDQAKRAQAKNDITQIVTAVNAFYTEYGRYPTTRNTDIMLAANNSSVLDVLRNNTAGSNSANVTSLNPRQIVFTTPANAKDPTNPRSGIATQNASVGGVAVQTGDFVDPWGKPYIIAIDSDYSGYVQVGTALNYSDVTYATDPATGSAAVAAGAIAASYGKDNAKATKLKASDDVVSWQ